MQISAVVIAKNEEKNIKRCLQSLSWCNEVVVVDDYSTDTTTLKLRGASKTVKVYKRRLNNDFSAQRNFGLLKAKNDWVLFLDADEIVAPALRDEIIQLFSYPISQNGFYIYRQDVWNGKLLKFGEFSKYGWFGNTKLLRLAKRDAGKWERPVHEFWDVKDKVGVLKNPIMHFPHADLRDFIDKINFFSSLHAIALKKEGKRSGIVKIIVWPMGKFFYNYTIRLGFLDGLEGFIICVLMSMHSFLAWSKLWLI